MPRLPNVGPSREAPEFGSAGPVAPREAEGYGQGVGPVTHWRGRPDTLDKRLRWLVLASALFHVPATPLLGLLGLVGLLKPDSAPLITDPLTDIPIDLFEGTDLGEAAPAPATVAPPEPATDPDA